MVVVAERFGDNRRRKFEDMLVQRADPAEPGRDQQESRLVAVFMLVR
ncbi:hypothetical protein [Nocardia sp. NPDC005825]